MLEIIEALAVGGLAIGSLIIGIIAVVVLIALWILARFIYKKVLTKMGVPVTGLIYVPVIGTWHVIGRLGSCKAFKFFGMQIPILIPQIFMIVNLIGTASLPWFGKLAMWIIGVVVNGAYLTRFWDVADSKPEGSSSTWGLASAIIPIVFTVKVLIVLCDGQTGNLNNFLNSNGALSSSSRSMLDSHLSEDTDQSIYSDFR